MFALRPLHSLHARFWCQLIGGNFSPSEVGNRPGVSETSDFYCSVSYRRLELKKIDYFTKIKIVLPEKSKFSMGKYHFIEIL